MLGDIDYTGENKSITSAEALADPYDTDLTLDTGLLARNSAALSTMKPRPRVALHLQKPPVAA